MKKREYKEMGMLMFCPSCHRQVKSPFASQKINVIGNFNLKCGCGNGVVVVHGNPKKEI